MMQRFDDWPTRLDAFFRATESRPLAWGAHDCCLFAASAVEAMTGTDYALDWRGTYTTRAGAMRLLVSLGGMEAVVTDALGQPVAPLMAGRGDIVMLPGETMTALGVVDLTGRRVRGIAPDGAGIVDVALAHATKGWRV